MRAGRFADALVFAERAVLGQNACVPAHGMLATILLQLGRPQDAEMVVSRALEYKIGCADAYDGLAHVSLLLRRHDRSNALYRRVVELAPDNPRFWYNLASSERSFGRLLEAEVACNRAISLDSKQYANYLLRSELRVQSPDTNHVEELQVQLHRPHMEDRARVLLGYALAKELDDLGQFEVKLSCGSASPLAHAGVISPTTCLWTSENCNASPRPSRSGAVALRAPAIAPIGTFLQSGFLALALRSWSEY